MSTQGTLTDPVADRMERTEPGLGRGTALRLNDSRFGEMHDFVVEAIDGGGCVVLSGGHIEPGTVLSLGFEIHGHPGRRGIVEECLPFGGGFRWRIFFSGRLAA